MTSSPSSSSLGSNSLLSDLWALTRVALQVSAVCAAVKGIAKLHYCHEHSRADGEVQRLRSAFQAQPLLRTTATIIDETGSDGPRLVSVPNCSAITTTTTTGDAGGSEASFASSSTATSAAGRVEPITIRILSVTSRSTGSRINPNNKSTYIRWRKEENCAGVYGAERYLARVHFFTQPRWALSPSVSPVCTALETYMRLKKIPYSVHTVKVLHNSSNGLNEARVDDIPQEFKTPEQFEAERAAKLRRNAEASGHQRLPFIVYKGEVVSESPEAIVDFLAEKFNFARDYNAATVKQRAVAHSLRRTLRYTLSIEYELGMLLDAPGVFARYAGQAMGVPALLMWAWVALPFFSGLRDDLHRNLKAHDLGSLTAVQRDARLLADLRSLEDFLRASGYGSTDSGTSVAYMFGTEPTFEDCVVYAYVMPLVRMKDDEVASANANFCYVHESAVFRAFVTHMTERAFPDFEKIVNQFCGVHDDVALARKWRRSREAAQHAKQQQQKEKYHHRLMGKDPQFEAGSLVTDAMTIATPHDHIFTRRPAAVACNDDDSEDSDACSCTHTPVPVTELHVLSTSSDEKARHSFPEILPERDTMLLETGTAARREIPVIRKLPPPSVHRRQQQQQQQL